MSKVWGLWSRLDGSAVLTKHALVLPSRFVDAGSPTSKTNCVKPMLDSQGTTLDVSERSPSSVPVSKAFADADLNSAYALLATRFPDETFSPDFVLGGGIKKVRAGLVAALVTIIALLVVRNFS